MSRRMLARTLAAVAAFACLMADSAVAESIVDYRWNGPDLILRFSGDVERKIDLAASDTSQAVIRLRAPGIAAANPAAGSAINGGLRGRDQAILVPGTGADELVLTVRSNSRLGYATVWRPYSHTLVVHTFQWKGLEYPQEQFYKGLLAMEQGLEETGAELLEIARSTGDNRAASVLGVYYARKGNHKRAAGYLTNPIDADDYAALAATQRAIGDADGARNSQQRFEQMTGAATPNGSPSAPVKPDVDASAPRPDTVGGEMPDGPLYGASDLESNDDVRAAQKRRWLFMIGGIVLLLAIVWAVSRFTRRPPPRRDFESDLDPIIPEPDLHAPTKRPTGPADIMPTDIVEEAVVVASPPAGRHETIADPRAERPDNAWAPAADVPDAQASFVSEHIVVEHAPAEHTPAEHVAAEHVPVEHVAAEHVAAEHVPVEHVAAEHVAAEHVAAEHVPVEHVPVEYVVAEPVESPAAAAPAVEDDGPSAIASSTAPATLDVAPREEAERTMQTQAAELRRRIEAMRAQTVGAPPAGPERETTIAEARRLQLSRDSVDLRRRMEQARGRRHQP